MLTGLSRTALRRRRTTASGRGSSRRCSGSAARSACTRATRRRSIPRLIAEEKAELERLGATLHGQRYHYLRVDPHANLAPLADLGFAYGSGPVDRDRLRSRHGSLARYKAAAAAKSWSDVRRARIALLVSLPVVVAMTLTSWWLPRDTSTGDQDSRPRVLVVTPGAVLCGELTGGAKAFTILTDKSTTPRRVPAAEVVSLAVVDSCPP